MKGRWGKSYFWKVDEKKKDLCVSIIIFGHGSRDLTKTSAASGGGKGCASKEWTVFCSDWLK